MLVFEEAPITIPPIAAVPTPKIAIIHPGGPIAPVAKASPPMAAVPPLPANRAPVATPALFTESV